MKWDDLTMKEKAAMMKVAIQNGVYNINTIKHKFDEGGNLNTIPKDNTYVAPIMEYNKKEDETFSEKFRKRLYRTVTPIGYDIKDKLYNFITNTTRERINNSKVNEDNRDAYWTLYLGLDKKDTGIDTSKYFTPSKYKPTKGSTYESIYSINNDSTNLLSNDALLDLIEYNEQTGKNIRQGKVPLRDVGTYTESLGEDEKGTYMSYYDEWDINPFRGYQKSINIPFLESIGDIIPFSKPFSLYNRRYYTKEEVDKLRKERESKKERDLNGYVILK